MGKGMKKEVIVYSCDRCQRGDMSEEFINKSGSRAALLRNGRGRWKNQQITTAEMDLCDKCTGDLMLFLEQGWGVISPAA